MNFLFPLFAATRPETESQPANPDTWRTQAPRPRDKLPKDTSCTPAQTALSTKWNTSQTLKTVSSPREHICPHHHHSQKRWSVPTNLPTRTPPPMPVNTTRGVSRSTPPNGIRWYILWRNQRIQQLPDVYLCKHQIIKPPPLLPSLVLKKNKKNKRKKILQFGSVHRSDDWFLFKLYFVQKPEIRTQLNFFFSFRFLFLFFFIFPDERYKEMSLIVDVSVVTSLCMYSFDAYKCSMYISLYVCPNEHIIFVYHV